MKDDIQQFRAVCRALKMTRDQELLFSEHIHGLKDVAEGGTKNERGDFTWDELMQLGREFLGQEES